MTNIVPPAQDQTPINPKTMPRPMDTNFNTLCKLCSINTTAADLNPESIDWQIVWQLALRHRVVPVMTDGMKRLGITAPDGIARQMDDHNRQNLLKGMKQSAELVYLTQLFEKHDIPFLAFKGLAFNQLTGLELNQRHTGDIDVLLASTDDVWRTDQLLQAEGYQRKTPIESALNAPQQRYYLKHGKDLTCWHPQKAIYLELHFKLFNNDHLIDLSSGQLYTNHSLIKIGSVSIPVISKNDHQLYILIHGAISCWFRLKWLSDVPRISDNGQAYLSPEFWSRVKALGVERMVTQSLWLAHEQLGMPITEEVKIRKKNDPAIKKLILAAKQYQVEGEPHQRVFSGVFDRLYSTLASVLRYPLLLRNQFIYKLTHIKSYLVSYIDWQTHPLPTTLFWLYYPLRPVLWLKRWL